MSEDWEEHWKKVSAHPLAGPITREQYEAQRKGYLAGLRRALEIVSDHWPLTEDPTHKRVLQITYDAIRAEIAKREGHDADG